MEFVPPGEGVGTALHVLLPSSSWRHVPQRVASFGPRQPAPGGQEASQDTPPVRGEREREKEREGGRIYTH